MTRYSTLYEQDPPSSEYVDAYIAYDRADEQFVTSVVRIMQNEGVKVFFDQDMTPGDNWLRRLAEGLSASRVMVVFLTPKSLKSGWVNEEWTYAVAKAVTDRSRTVIPVLLQGVKQDQLPPFLSAIQPLDRSTVDPEDPAVRKEVGRTLARMILQGRKGASVPPVMMPFIVFAMTQDEARKLLGRRRRLGEEERRELLGRKKEELEEEDKLNLLMHELEEMGYDDQKILSFYGASRDDWRPPLHMDVDQVTGRPLTIRQTIDGMLARLSEEGKFGEQEVGADYLSSHTFSPVRVERNSQNEALRKGRKYVLIVDSLSLFYTELRRILEQSGLLTPESRGGIPIVVPPPYLPAPRNIDDILEDAMMTMVETPYFRFNEELDILCELGVRHPRALKRWLFYVLPMAVLGGPGPQPDSLRIFRKIS